MIIHETLDTAKICLDKLKTIMELSWLTNYNPREISGVYFRA